MPALPFGSGVVQPNGSEPFEAVVLFASKTETGEIHVADIGRRLVAGDKIEVREFLHILYMVGAKDRRRTGSGRHKSP